MEERKQLCRRYLGQTTWSSLCARMGVDVDGLPKTIAEVLATNPDDE